MTYNVEMTDTFGDEANYSWVRHYQVQASDTRRSIVRAAKAATGLSGVRCKVADYGDIVEIRPRHDCVVVFVEISEFDR